MKTYLLFRHTPLKGNGIIGLGSLIIRSVTNSYWDHVEILIRKGMKEKCYSAGSKGVRKISFKDWKDLYKQQDFLIAGIPTNINEHELESKLEHWVLLKTHFSYIELICQLFYDKFSIWLGGKKPGKSWYCSAFVSYIIGLKEWYKQTPGNLHLMSSIKKKINEE